MCRVNVEALKKEGYRVEYIYSIPDGEGYFFKSTKYKNKRRQFPYVFSVEIWEGKPIISLPEKYRNATLFKVWVKKFINSEE